MSNRDVMEILIALVTIGGSVMGAFMGAKISITRLEERMNSAEGFIVELRAMKHLKVDPYLPGAVDAIEERVSKLEKKHEQP